MDHSSTDGAGQQAYEYNPEQYNQSYDAGRYSPTVNSRSHEDLQYLGRNRSRSPDRAYNSVPSRPASIPDNYASQGYYPNSDAPSLSQRDPLATRSENEASQAGAQATLYVRNIPPSFTEQQVVDLFQQHGSVENCTFLLNHQTGRPRGVAFVKMGSSEEAENAMQTLQDYMIDSRPITIERARLDNPREKTPGLYKGRYPTRYHNADRGRRGDSYRAHPDEYARDSSRDMFRPSGYRRSEPSGPSGPPSRYPSRYEDFDRPPLSAPRGGRSPPRSRGGRYNDPGYPTRDYRSYDRGYSDKSYERPGDRPGYYERPPRGSRDGPPSRYYDSGPRGSFPSSTEPRMDRPNGYSAGYSASYGGGDRRRV